jgi:hypothetical protein
LGKFFLALAERGLNILAFQSYVQGRESLTRLLVDNPDNAKTILGSLGMIFEETEAVVVRLPHSSLRTLRHNHRFTLRDLLNHRLANSQMLIH